MTVAATPDVVGSESSAFRYKRRTALLLLFLAFTLSILDRQILSILAEPIRPGSSFAQGVRYTEDRAALWGLTDAEPQQ
ncbi:MAG: hypothetical protein HXY25_02945 [Alphaproteobacteria bacterium]|nr:hypothetical protein [Alphaproteobacteria bacterium]